LYEEMGTEYITLFRYCDLRGFLREINTHVRTNGWTLSVLFTAKAKEQKYAT